MPNALPADHHKGYRHPFLFGIHYLGGVGGTQRIFALASIVFTDLPQIIQEL